MNVFYTRYTSTFIEIIAVRPLEILLCLFATAIFCNFFSCVKYEDDDMMMMIKTLVKLFREL